MKTWEWFIVAALMFFLTGHVGAAIFFGLLAAFTYKK
jgi:hypothetical protein